ncbi:MAG: hypothetical protein IBX45_12250, partial [Campylobacterales bacterium]|nr:hypothetical protein [Campylobacterales bacterium]
MRFFLLQPFRHTSLEFRLIFLGLSIVFLLTLFHIAHYATQHQHLKTSYIHQVAQKNIQNAALLAQMHLEDSDTLLVLFRRLQLNNPEMFYIGLSRQGQEFLHVVLEDTTFPTPPLHLEHTISTTPP